MRQTLSREFARHALVMMSGREVAGAIRQAPRPLIVNPQPVKVA